MRSLRSVAIPAFLALEVVFKLVFVRAFGNAFAPAGDHAWVTRLFVEATIPVTATWLVVIAALTGHIGALRRDRSVAARRRVVAALCRLPRQLALAWCVNWCATLAIVAGRAGALASPQSVVCLLLTVAMGASVLAHALTVWLVESHLCDLSRERHLPVTTVPHSLRARLAGYGLGLCGAPAMYFASLAFAVRVEPMSSAQITTEILFQSCATVGLAIASAVLLSLSIIGPVRRMATIMQTIARGVDYACVDRMPLLQNDELGALSDATNQMLDRLERSDRERLALLGTLEHKVEERTALLQNANEQIAHDFEARGRMELKLRRAQQLETVGRLAAGIAHEINTPVQFVSNSLEFVRAGIAELVQLLDGDGELIARVVADLPARDLATAAATAAAAADLPYLRVQLPLAVERALEGLDRVTTIIRSMKNHAHPGRSEMATHDLNSAIMSTLTIARNEYKYVAELETELGELPPVHCQIGDFNQVIVNLVVNAAHAIADVVGASGTKGRLTVKTWRDGADAVITVGDTGGGIPERIREQIFDPFFTTKPVGKGTGQGLAIAHAVIVEKHGGSLGFETRPDEGTTFQIRIPIAGSTATSPPAAEAGAGD
jgi:signal transduction histidine kinase